MKLDRLGTPSEVAEITRVLRTRSARLYISLLVLTLLCLLVFGLIANWPKGTDAPDVKFCTALYDVAKSSYMNFFSTLFGMLLSIFIARFLFGDNPPEHSAVDAGVMRITKSNNALQLVVEIADRIEKQGRNEVIISDNWLCALQEDMFRALEVAIISAIEKGARITFVLMHPNSPMVHRRELVVSKVGHNVVSRIRSSLELLRQIYQECVRRDLFDKSGGSLSVFCADSYLSLSTYVLPQVAYVGFFGAKDTSMIGPQLLTQVPSMMGEMVTDYAREARNVCLYRQKVFSYGQKGMQYGTQVNLASVDPNNCLENTTMPKSLKEQLLHLSEKLNAQGACSIENIFDQILDSQIIDVFNILSKPNAVTRLVTFLDEYPASLGERRKSKVELASVIADLDKRL